MEIIRKSNKLYKESNKRNPKVPTCPYCSRPLVRVFGKDGEIKCNHCGARLDRPVGSDPKDGRYVKCSYCGYEGPELVNPTRNTVCPRCGKHILQTEVNKTR